MNIPATSHAPQPTYTPPAAAPVDKPNDGDADDAAPAKAAVGPGVGGAVDITA